MIKSMTGFASITREDDRATIAVTMRSVNHRYLDLQLRVPQALAAIESDVRALVGKRVSRGRVEVGLSFQLRQVPGVDASDRVCDRVELQGGQGDKPNGPVLAQQSLIHAHQPLIQPSDGGDKVRSVWDDVAHFGREPGHQQGRRHPMAGDVS